MSNDGLPAGAGANIPLNSRLAHEIPKPKDWQAFQRNCALLFQAELNDPNAQEYGRSGQSQGGIDVLGKRNGDTAHYVGVQCRHIANPMSEASILKECRAALKLEANLKEIIFATTAPDDTGATDAAIRVERTLRSEGYDLEVVVYGWGALQNKIAVHEFAYAAFFPAIVATMAPQAPATTTMSNAEFAALVAAQVVAQLRQPGVAILSSEPGIAAPNDEDPALHARIDTFRDLFKDKQPRIAEKGLLALLEKESLDDKPWARFRIETNLGSIAITMGRQMEGAARYEAAYALRPDDANAVANLALARTIQGHFNEGMALARQALDAKPRADHAVGCLLQAAARSTWQGDPNTLIPADLVGSEHADLGLAEFLRRREIPGWAERGLELSRRHAKADAFRRVGAIAVLVLVLEAGEFLSGGKAPVTLEELNRAADDMKAEAEHCLDIGFADEYDLIAYVNNASMLLRASGRHAECEALVIRALPKVQKEPSLRRILALSQAAQGRRDEALATLAVAGQDPESRILSVELIAAGDPVTALARALAIDASTLDARLARLRWRLIGEMALKTGQPESLRAAVAGLRALDDADVTAELLEIRGEQKAGLDGDAVKRRLRAVAAALGSDADMTTRYFVAEELYDQDLPGEACALLEGHVDLDRRSLATTLYLQSLAAARRDDAFRKALKSAGREVRDDPETLGTVAAHAWNVGDLAGAFRAVETLLTKEPDNPRARLLKIEILVRQNRSAELLAELDKPIEDLARARLQDRFRIAGLLGHFGYVERAAAFAYRLFIEHRDDPQAWMALSTLVLEGGRGADDCCRHWNAPTVALNVAVDLRYDDGQQVFFVVEPDASLRQFDEESWEPEHALVQRLMGSGTGTRFVDPGGRDGTVAQLRHKYVARLHFVMQHYEARFPTVEGFRSVPVEAERPGGLDDLIAEVKARHDWFKQEQEQYRNGPWPLGVLAHRLGLDTIDAAGGLAAQGILLKVAIGSQAEIDEGRRAVRENAQRGCVLDLLAFWTAWRLQALDGIAATCGPVRLTQSLMDRLRVRREQIDYSANDGLRSMGYAGGKLTLNHVTPEAILEQRDDLDRAIAWAEANATICPLVAGDELPPALREHLRAGRDDIFDSIVLSMQSRVLLVTDDLPTRDFNRSAGGGGAAWLHVIFGVALDQRRIDLEAYVRWSAALVGAGHSYIGISGQVLARALRMDAEAGQAPGHLFETLSKVIGGRSADPLSHIRACVACLRDIWSHHASSGYRQPATGALLTQLLRERCDD